MRTKKTGKQVFLWASRRDTEEWANRPGKKWPCSTLSGNRLYAEFYDGDLVQVLLNGHMGEHDNLDVHEFNAFIEDAFGTVNPK